MRKQENGFVIASLIITTTLVVAVGASVTSLIVNNHTLARRETHRLGAQLAADSAADRAIAELNYDKDWCGTGGEVVLFTNNDYETRYEVTISDCASSTEKTINVTGRTYFPATATDPIKTRKYSVDVRSIGSAGGTLSIVTGVGGLIMENSAKIVAGDVFVNGTITMSNTAQIGLSSDTTPLNVKSAHYSCPTGGGATYPDDCTAGDGEPISISGPAHIYGDVCATNQIDGSGMSNGGLDTSCSDPPNEDLPLHDRATQKANVTPANTTSNPADLICNSNTEQRTWPAGYKLEGNVEIKKKCEITLEGDVWITGTLTLSNSAKMIVSDTIVLGGTNTVDAKYPTVMVDGYENSSSISLNNSSQVVANSTDVGAQLITYWNVSSDLDTDITGQDLFDSSRITTIYLEQSAQAPASILYAKWSQVDLNNGGDIGALVGQTVKLRNSAAVTFGASVGGGSGLSSITWLVENYRRSY